MGFLVSGDQAQADGVYCVLRIAYCVLGVEVQCLAQIQLALGPLQVGPGFRTVGIEVQGAAEVLNGLVQVTQGGRDSTDVAEGAIVARLDVQRLTTGRQGLVEASLQIVADAQVVVSVGEAGVQLDGASKGRLRLCQPAGLLQSQPLVVRLHCP